MVSLSRLPTLVDDHLEGRHVDLRRFVVTGERTEVLVGGSKDTWVLSDESDEDDHDAHGAAVGTDAPA